jgi:homogentisate 1,2-dioxygenase
VRTFEPRARALHLQRARGAQQEALAIVRAEELHGPRQAARRWRDRRTGSHRLPPAAQWMAVARGAGWHTKQFEGGGTGGPALLSWNTLPRALDTEARIARLAAWVLAAERTARAFSLAAPGVALPAGQGRLHRRAALTALALLPTEAE